MPTSRDDNWVDWGQVVPIPTLLHLLKKIHILVLLKKLNEIRQDKIGQVYKFLIQYKKHII